MVTEKESCEPTVAEVDVALVKLSGGGVALVTVRVKDQVPLSPSASASVPPTVYVPAARVPVVLMAPLEETEMPAAGVVTA